jgi:hypothetical protein
MAATVMPESIAITKRQMAMAMPRSFRMIDSFSTRRRTGDF